MFFGAKKKGLVKPSSPGMQSSRPGAAPKMGIGNVAKPMPMNKQPSGKLGFTNGPNKLGPGSMGTIKATTARVPGYSKGGSVKKEKK